jgi:hypothetical protein
MNCPFHRHPSPGSSFDQEAWTHAEMAGNQWIETAKSPFQEIAEPKEKLNQI